MDVVGTVPERINCHSCQAEIEVGGQAPFTQVECPRCSALAVVPVQFGHFLLLSTVGIGGMGTVYKAFDQSLNRYLALKILRQKLAANSDFIDNFSREARAAAAVNHPNVAQVYSFGEHHGQYYLAMELLERGSLDDRIMRLGKVPEKEVLEIGVQIASALRAAYLRNLLHRDVKPGNILFNAEGVPKIVDFGLARPDGGEQGGGDGGQIWGTPYYIAPEKLRGQPEDFRSDMYSLGATLFHALAGRPPFDAATAGEVVTKHATQPLFSLKTFAPTTNDYTVRVIARTLAKNPAERHASYDDFIRDLQEAQGILRVAEATRTIVAPTGERVPVGPIISAVVGLVVCVAVVWFVWAHRARIFKEAPVPPAPVPVTNAVGPGVGPPVVTEEQWVDFGADTPWVRTWTLATQQLAQGLYQDALLGYDSAARLPSLSLAQRQWGNLFEGWALLASGRPSEAQVFFVKAIDPQGRDQIPTAVTKENFAGTLARFMEDKLSGSDLEGARARLPAWANALSRWAIGLKQMQTGEFALAGAALRTYQQLSPDPGESWVFLLQPLAERLAGDCDLALKILADVSDLEEQAKYDAALEAVQAAYRQTSLIALKTQLATQEARIRQAIERQQQQAELARQEAERRRQEELERERQRAAEEGQVISQLDLELNPFWQRYDFKTALARYRTFGEQLKTPSARQLLAQRLAATGLLRDFKAQLAADFARQPYGGEVSTRSGIKPAGKIVRATDPELVFATKYGEVVIPWRDLAPATLARIARQYFDLYRTAEKVDAQARRLLLLSVFYRQYELDGAAVLAKQAIQFDPAVQPQVELVFGKEPEPVPAPAPPAPETPPEPKPEAPK